MEIQNFFGTRAFRWGLVAMALGSQIMLLPAFQEQTFWLSVLATTYSFSLVGLVLVATSWKEFFLLVFSATLPVPLAIGGLLSAVLVAGFFTHASAAASALPHHLLELGGSVFLTWAMMVLIPGWPIMLAALALRIFSRRWARAI